MVDHAYRAVDFLIPLAQTPQKVWGVRICWLMPGFSVELQKLGTLTVRRSADAFRPGAAGRVARGSTAGIKRRAVARYDHSRTIGLPTHSGRAPALVTTSAVKRAAATVNAALAHPRRERGHSGFQGAPPRTGTPSSWSGKRAMSLASKGAVRLIYQWRKMAR